MSTRPVAADASRDECLHGAAVAHVHVTRAAQSHRAAAQCAPSRASSSSITSHAQTLAPRSRERHADGAPETVRGAGDDGGPARRASVFTSRSRRGRRRERVQRLERLRAGAALDVMDQLDEARGQRRRHAGFPRELHHDAELRIDFGRPLAHGEVAPDAAVRLGRAPVVGDERVE